MIADQDLAGSLALAVYRITEQFILPKLEEEIAAFIQEDMRRLLEGETSEHDDETV